MGQSHVCLHLHHVLQAGSSSRSHQLIPNFYAHPTMTIASMPGNYRSFPTLYASCRRFAVIKPYKHYRGVTQRVFCVRTRAHVAWGGGHIGHAHMLPKVGVISCMPPHAPCTSRTIRVCRRASLKEVFLAGPTK